MSETSRRETRRHERQRFTQTAAVGLVPGPGRDRPSWSLAVGADEPKKTIEAGGLTFKAPEAWKSIPTGPRCARPSCRSSRSRGTTSRPLLVVFAFPGGAGTVEANVKRWQKPVQGRRRQPAQDREQDGQGEERRGDPGRDRRPLRPRADPGHARGARARRTPACSAPSSSRTRSATSSRWSAPTRR